MRIRPFKYFVVLISLLAFFLTGQAGGNDHFWCLGEDGQAALESLNGDDCGSGQQAHDSDCHNEATFALSLQEEFCGPCLDLPVSLHATSSRHFRDQQKIPAPLSLSAAIQTFSKSGSTQTLAAGLSPQPPPGTSKTLLFHRTVVLLI
jgi:hypothetical protein